MLTFSKRYRTRLRHFQVVISDKARRRIIAAMKACDFIINREWEETVFKHVLPRGIEREIGEEVKWTESWLSEKASPANLFDACEIFYHLLRLQEHSKAQEFKDSFQRLINVVFQEETLPYVMVDGEIKPTDIGFIGGEIVAKADELLEEHGIKGALEELRKACEAFANKRFEETVLKANHALESVRKAILGVEKMKPGEQCQKVIEEVVPEHFEGFQALLKKIMEATDALRHNAPSAGHGQGKEPRQVSPQLAELALHLNSALIIYLLREWRTPNCTLPEFTNNQVGE